MREIPKGSDIYPSGHQKLVISERPTEMPEEATGKALVCKYTTSEVPPCTWTFVCESVGDMHELWDAESKGMATLCWYICDDMVRVQPLEEWSQEHRPGDDEVGAIKP